MQQPLPRNVTAKYREQLKPEQKQNVNAIHLNYVPASAGLGEKKYSWGTQLNKKRIFYIDMSSYKAIKSIRIRKG